MLCGKGGGSIPEGVAVVGSSGFSEVCTCTLAKICMGLRGPSSARRSGSALTAGLAKEVTYIVKAGIKCHTEAWAEATSCHITCVMFDGIHKPEQFASGGCERIVLALFDLIETC